MMFEKYKDALPQESIARARRVCETVGASVNVKITKRLDGVYSAVLSEQNCGWVTCGKGTTQAYCEASAFGEAIEHMSHYFAYNMNDLSEAAQESGGFQRYPDEQILSIDQIPVLAPEVMSDLRAAYSLATGRIPADEELCAFLKKVFNSDTTVFVPYFSIRHRRSVLLPEILIANLCGTNGCGAGNTPEEAVGHGLDELAERFVKYRIYHDGITPPEIPRDHIEQTCPETAQTIEQIESSGKLRVVVKDCSLGQSFPVVAVILIDYENQRYLANLGAHPRFEIALERCITEMFQFYESGTSSVKRKKMSHWTAVPPYILESTKNWVSLLKDDVGFLPDSFFAGAQAWEFVPWPQANDYSNKQGVNFLVQVFSQISEDIFIRNNSYLGFPAYRVYIPGVSTTQLPFDESQLQCVELCSWMMGKNQRQELFSQDDLRTIKDRVFSPRLFASSLFFHNMAESVSYALYAALLYELGDADEALVLLRLQDDLRCTAAAKVVELRRANAATLQIEQLVRLFFDNEATEFAMCWLGDNVFGKVLGQYSGHTMALRPVQIQRKRETATDRLHMRIKAEMTRHSVEQEAAAAFLDKANVWE